MPTASIEKKPTASQQRSIAVASSAAVENGLPSAHGAVLTRGGKVAAVGTNSPFAPAGHLECSLHAEIDALMRLRVNGEAAGSLSSERKRLTASLSFQRH